MQKEKSERFRVVLDTNIYVSAFTSRPGPPLSLWKRARRGSYRLLVSPTIIRELARVLRERFFWGEEQVLLHLKLIASAGEVIAPKAVPVVIERDPADNEILACAIAGRADLIVTGDRDLLRLKSYDTVGIVRPRDFLRTLGGT